MNPILAFKNVSYSYHTLTGEINTLSDLTFSIYPGEFIAFVGPSGCGKSTLLNIIAGLLIPSSGEILVNNNPVKSSTLNIGYMLQKDHLLEWRTIYKNITLGLEIQKNMTPKNLLKINTMFETYGLMEFSNSYPRQLSGGMRQRAALIRTLALSPDILLLDEPFSALDYQTRLNVSNDIGTIIKNNNMTAFLVTHDLSEAISMAQKVIVLSKRPATIKSQYTIDFSQGVHTPKEARNSREFKDYFNQIWKDIEN